MHMNLQLQDCKQLECQSTTGGLLMARWLMAGPDLPLSSG